MACVRVKRRLSEGASPSPAIVVKRLRRTDQHDEPHENQAETIRKSDASEAEEFKAIFKFVGTVESKDDIVDSHISRAVVNECRAASSSGDWRRKRSDRTSIKKCNVKDRARRQRIKDQKKAFSTEARYRLISTLRGVDANDGPFNRFAHDGRGDAKGSTFEEAVKGLYTLYDIEELPAINLHAPSTNISEQITCNGVTMICEEKLSIAPKYVYDLYFLHDCDVAELESTQDPVCIEPWSDYEGQDLRNTGCDDSDSEAAEDDDDSNDESNWRNDYPEEDDDFEKDYDYYRDYDNGDSDIDEQLMEEFKAYTIESPSTADLECGDDEESRCFEEDVRLHGRTYAEYKVRLRSYVSSETSSEILKDSKSSNTLN